MKYTKAPVSEVILGITFVDPVFDINFLFKIQQMVEADFPKVEITPPLTDEWLDEFHLVADFNPESTGAILIRLRSIDLKWLIQIQSNKIYFNWVRGDEEEVGNYVGYEAIKEKFEHILNQINIEPFLSKIKYFDITYHDRIILKDYISSINEVGSLINTSLPKINTVQGFNSIFSKYTYQLPEFDGYGILSVNTDVAISGSQVLRLENAVRGTPKCLKIKNDFFAWFDSAHKYQNNYFEDLFTTELLKQWE